MRVVFKNMVVHPQQVQRAHLAGCAAGKQGKFLDYYRAFWDQAYKPYAEQRDMTKLGEENVMAIAGTLGLDLVKLKADMDGPECAQLLASDEAELQKFGVNGTPAFFINGKFIGGGIPKEAFHTIIDEQLKTFASSGVPAEQFYTTQIMGKGLKKFRSAKEAKKAAQGAEAAGGR